MQETPRPQSELYRSVMGDIAGRVMETEANLPAGLAQAMPSSPADREPTQAFASASRLARRLISSEHAYRVAAYPARRAPQARRPVSEPQR